MLSGPGRRRELIGTAAPELALEHAPYEPATPPAPELGAELARLRAEKEAAIAGQDFDRAALLRDRERRLTASARALENLWHEGGSSGRPEPD
jgi:ATP-dependent Clp protease ATP-binding subunit ClpC